MDSLDLIYAAFQKWELVGQSVLYVGMACLGFITVNSLRAS